MFLLGKSNLLAISLPAAARALEQSGALGKVKLTGLAPASLIKKYIVDGRVQDIWWNGTDLGYLYSLYFSKRNFYVAMIVLSSIREKSGRVPSHCSQASIALIGKSTRSIPNLIGTPCDVTNATL